MPKTKEEPVMEPISTEEWKSILGAFPGKDMTSGEIRGALTKIRDEGQIPYDKIDYLEDRIHGELERRNMLFKLDWFLPRGQQFKVRVIRRN